MPTQKEMRVADLLLVVVTCWLVDISYANIPADLTDRMFTCEQARKRFAQIDISCEDDGSYSPRQCNRHHFQGRCVCVDPNTGEWLTEYPAFRENDRIDCITSFPEKQRDSCPSLQDCRRVCQFGREVDDKQCPICSCVLERDDAGNEKDDEDEESSEDLIYCNKTCPTVQMLSRNCKKECLVINEVERCPACNRTCMQSQNGVPDGATVCDDHEDCADNQLCLRRGMFGQSTCFDRPSVDEECSVLTVSEEAKKALLATSGAAARTALATLQRARIPCREGLACISVSLQRKICRPDSELGSSEACIVNINGENIEFKHGSSVLNRANCSRCLCINGRLRYCQQATEDCAALSLNQTSRQSCKVEDRGEIQHGKIFKVDCNICGCRFGRLTCTHRQCESDDGDNQTQIENREARCLRCRFHPRVPVCGPNGRTYASYCHAVECAGFSPVTLLRGPCTVYDVCKLSPCDEGEVCVKRGGVSCFGLRGCDLRLCVDPAELVCVAGEEEEDVCINRTRLHRNESDNTNRYICGTNGRSYRSICHLLQDTGSRGQVAHIGRCNAKECQGGPVCGTDGITYENVCLLRSQSGTGRVDYRGNCDRDDESLENMCKRIRKNGRCRFSRDNCSRLVLPENGCCPICGGVVVVAIDSVGLSYYVQLNSDQADTISTLLEQLIDFLNVTNRRCYLEGALTDSGNLELVFSPVSDNEDDSEFCNRLSVNIAEKINSAGVSSGGDGRDRESIPALVQYVSGAVSAPLIEEGSTTTEDGDRNDAKTATAIPLMLVLQAALGSILTSYI